MSDELTEVWRMVYYGVIATGHKRLRCASYFPSWQAARAFREKHTDLEMVSLTRVWLDGRAYSDTDEGSP